MKKIEEVTVKTPVALFTYNRPLHTDRALEALSKCYSTEACEFYFFSDGSRTKDDNPHVDATREVLKKWAEHFKARLIVRDENFGLAKSIVSGVTELCGQYGQVIVVEDDLVVAPGFLHYMLESLKRYEKEEKVMQVAGFTISAPKNLSTDVFLLPITTTWGWATWKRAWQNFSWQPVDLDIALSDAEWLSLFDMNGSCSFSSMLDDRLAGRNDSWGILWWYAVSRRNGLVAYPKKSLVWNGGFDGSGVHCGPGRFAGQKAPESLSNVKLSGAIAFPSKIVCDPSHLTQLEDYFRAQPSNILSGRVFRSVYRKITGLLENIKMRVRNAFN